MTARSWLWMAAASVALCGCLPDELSDAQLVGWCKVDADCAAKDEYACLQAKCTANQCVPTGSVVTPHTACHTSTCSGACVCSAPKDKPGKPGVCFDPSKP